MHTKNRLIDFMFFAMGCGFPVIGALLFTGFEPSKYYSIQGISGMVIGSLAGAQLLRWIHPPRAKKNGAIWKK